MLLEVINRYRSSSMLLFLAVIIVAGCAITTVLSRVATIVPGSAWQIYYTVVAGLSLLFLLSFLAITMGERCSTVITDAGILYGGMFQRWTEIRCCAMRKTRRGLVVWVRTRRRIRMYFRGRDSETVEKLIRHFCREEVMSPDCRSG